MKTKTAGIIAIILLIIICAVGYITYSNPDLIMNSSTTAVGSSKVSIPEGYDIQKTADNGVLFSNSKTNIGIYEVPKGHSFDKKVTELKETYGEESVSTNSYMINDVELKTITMKNDKVKIKESYFEKNGIKYHIYEKGAEDTVAFNTLFNSINK